MRGRWLGSPIGAWVLDVACGVAVIVVLVLAEESAMRFFAGMLLLAVVGQEVLRVRRFACRSRQRGDSAASG